MKRRGGKGQGTSTYESHALVMESRGRSQNRFSHGKQDRESDNRKGKWKPRGRSQSRKGIKCYYCDKPGYIQKDCGKYKKDKKSKDRNKNEENGTTTVVFDGDVVIVCDDGYINLACQCHNPILGYFPKSPFFQNKNQKIK
jgi:hypothetical protein